MKDLGHSKVRDFCSQVLCQKDIIGREVTMNDWWGMPMEVVHSQGYFRKNGVDDLIWEASELSVFVDPLSKRDWQKLHY